jgi:Capsular polysaccharide synthesis protein
MKYFIYWDNLSNKPPPEYITLCINKMKQIFGDSLLIINKNNLKKYVLKLPPYFNRIPKIAIKVDYIRIALLYHHGGCYLDADTIIFPKFRDYIEKLPKEEGLWGVQSGNAIIIAPIAKSAACKKIMDRQEEVILQKKGLLKWSDIGGNLIRDIGGYTTIFPKTPLYFCGWKNCMIFLEKDEAKILQFLEKAKNYHGVVLYNQAMKKYIPGKIPEGTLLWLLLMKKN